MKHLVMLLMLTPLFAFAQSNGTTLEEYHYCTKGYQIQIESGLDPVKKGYEIKKIYTFDRREKESVSFIGLKEKSSLELKAIMIVVHTETSIIRTLCLPNGGSPRTINEMYQKSLIALPAARLQLVHIALSEYVHFTTKQLPDDVEPEIEKGEFSRAKTIVTSDIGGGLSGREVTSKGVPYNKKGQVGKIVIKVCVTPNGRVIKARYSTINSDISDEELVYSVLKAAKKFKFEKNPYAPDKQCGTIHFRFKARE